MWALCSKFVGVEPSVGNMVICVCDNRMHLLKWREVLYGRDELLDRPRESISRKLCELYSYGFSGDAPGLC
jgi:hypothetical protein